MDITLRHQPESKFISGPEGRLHYLEWKNPSAPYLVLLHGFTSHAHCWDFLADALAEEFHIFAMDLRGHGDSDWSPNGYSNEAMMEDLSAFLRTLGLQRFSLLGMSLGGLNAMGYTAANPDQVERLVLVDIGPQLPVKGKPREIFSLFTGQASFTSPSDAFQFRRKQDSRPVPDMERHLTYHALKQRDDGRWVWKFDSALRSPLRLFLVRTPLRRLTGVRLPDLWPVVDKIACPTLVLHGEDSPVLSRDVAEQMLRLLPNGKLVTFPRCGHRIHIERPQEFEAAIRDFLAAAHKPSDLVASPAHRKKPPGPHDKP
ncbi:MAG: alpha/beta hydrolase [Chloroflexi bacterium]|nr:alpha/beta hydrolase [Chloroflexota bacterium]